MKHKPPKDKKTIDLYGYEPRQEAAQKILPILIDMVINPDPDPKKRTITYGELSNEMLEYIPEKIRNTGKKHNGLRALQTAGPLGCIWHTLYYHAKDTNRKIPYLMTIVVKKHVKKSKQLPTIFHEKLGWSEKKIKKKQKEVFKFKHWQEILDEINEKIDKMPNP